MVATTFGLARYGYGLLLPDIRRSFGLSSTSLGLIATGSYAAIAYPPFSEAVARALPRRERGRALSIISSGTGWGVVAAVLVALVVGESWRFAWVAFAAIALLATVLVRVALRRLDGRPEAAGGEVLPLSWSWFVCPRSGPLLAGALLVGMGASVYWTFAPDFAASGAAGRGGAPLLLGVVGIASVLGSVAGDLLERIGGRQALRLSAAGLEAAFLVGGALILGCALMPPREELRTAVASPG